MINLRPATTDSLHTFPFPSLPFPSHSNQFIRPLPLVSSVSPSCLRHITYSLLNINVHTLSLKEVEVIFQVWQTGLYIHTVCVTDRAVHTYCIVLYSNLLVSFLLILRKPGRRNLIIVSLCRVLHTYIHTYIHTLHTYIIHTYIHTYIHYIYIHTYIYTYKYD